MENLKFLDFLHSKIFPWLDFKFPDPYEPWDIYKIRISSEVNKKKSKKFFRINKNIFTPFPVVK